MDKRLMRTVLIGLTCLILGIIASTAWWTYTLRPSNNSEANIIAPQAVLSLEEATEYLKLSAGDIQNIIALEQKTLEKSGVYYGERLPYIMVNNNYYFYKASLDKWLEDATTSRRQYNTLRGEITQK